MESPVGHLANTAHACPISDDLNPGDEASSPYTGRDGFIAGDGDLRSLSGDDLDSCRQCKKFLHKDQLPFPSPGNICGATGYLIGSSLDALVEAAHKCECGETGIPDVPVVLNGRSSNERIIQVNFPPQSTVTSAPTVAAARAIHDPVSYSSDLKIAEEHKGIIRAWRAVEVGEGDKVRTEYLPIFEPDYFSEAERKLIPETGSDEHPELYHDGSGIMESFVIDCLLNDEPLCLVGEPGSGKTEAGRWLAWEMQIPFHWFQITEETLPEDFIGKMGFKDGHTFFSWGRFPLAWVRPGLIMSDEFNTGQDAIRQAYRSVNTRSATLFLDGEEDAAKVVAKKHDYCFHLLSLNPSWDARNLGTREMADADVSRLSFKYVNEPKRDVIASIIVTVLEAEGMEITDDDLNNLLAVREDLKNLGREGSMPFSWSIRQDIKVARKLVHYSPLTAYRRALLDYCHPDVATSAEVAIRSHFGV
jgi:hypothetical protein